MIVVIIVFAVLFALAEVGPVSNLVALPPQYEALGYAAYIPWGFLVLGVLIPPVLYTGALLVGRGRPLFARALILTVALAATFALGFTVVALDVAF
jgi:hypothetical protein